MIGIKGVIVKRQAIDKNMSNDRLSIFFLISYKLKKMKEKLKSKYAMRNFTFRYI